MHFHLGWSRPDPPMTSSTSRSSPSVTGGNNQPASWSRPPSSPLNLPWSSSSLRHQAVLVLEVASPCPPGEEHVSERIPDHDLPQVRNSFTPIELRLNREDLRRTLSKKFLGSCGQSPIHQTLGHTEATSCGSTVIWFRRGGLSLRIAIQSVGPKRLISPRRF
jgi:hypothetical protein